MRVFRAPGDVPKDFGPSVVTIGNFDGVHFGHRANMRHAAALAAARGMTATVLTFDPHPARILAPARAPQLITTVDQRLRYMADEGIAAALLLPFSLDFARLTPEEFARQILVDTLHAGVVLVGEDFRFGHRQTGDIQTLRTLGESLGFSVEPVPAILLRAKRVSSTAIRQLVNDGDVSRACRLLGAPFTLEGEIVKGQGIGSAKTVPTLNLRSDNELAPKIGVYVTRTVDRDNDRRWNSITNVGRRPTFEGTDITIETFLLDPLEEPVPRRIELSFLKYLRDEVRFESPEALRAQILRDVGTARTLHRRLEKVRMG